MKVLIFDQSIDGHHLEYINHLYNMAAEDNERHYIFILNPEFEFKKKLLNWKETNNTTIDYFTKKELINFNKNAFVSSYFLCKALKNRIKRYSATEVFLINIISFLPFIIFFINNKIKVSGIVYLIYLYRWKKSNFFVKIQDILKYLIFSNSAIFKNIFLLNDQASPRYLNSKYNTKVFKYLPDPISNPNISKKSVVFRSDLKIPDTAIVYLHFGALNDRKGTIEILKALDSGKIKKMDEYYFIFAGKVGIDIKNDFYNYLNKLAGNKNILVFDKFCDYSFIESLCELSDFILMPYKVNEQSSGVLNYAAIFEKPVLGVNTGLIGRIIKKYKLGYLIENYSSHKIVDFFNKEIIITSNESHSNLYMKDNSIENFKKLIW